MLKILVIMLTTLLDLASLNINTLFRLIPQQNLVYLNFSLAPRTNIINTSKFGCFKKCLLNEFCLYVFFNNGLCGLYTEYVQNGFISSNTDSLYERKNLIEYSF